MIPTCILLGLAIGRWWAVPLSALAWCTLLLTTGTLDPGALPLAAAFAAGNAAVGVAPRWLYRVARSYDAPPAPRTG